MRPDRLVVGEVREAESLDLLIALNSGLPGMCTIHANSAQDALAKLCTLPLLAGRNIDSAFVVPTVASCIDLVVHLGIDRDGTPARRSRSPRRPVETTDAAVEAELIFSRRGGELVPTGPRPARTAKFVASGFDPEIVLAGGAGVSLILGGVLGLGVLLMVSPLLWPARRDGASASPAAAADDSRRPRTRRARRECRSLRSQLSASCSPSWRAPCAQAVFQIPVITVVAAVLGAALVPLARARARRATPGGEPRGVARRGRPPRLLGSGGHVTARQRVRAGGTRARVDPWGVRRIRRRLRPHRQLRRSASID